MASAIDLARDFRQLRVLVIGDSMLDSYLEGDAARLCSEGPVPVIQKRSESHMAGGAANMAANLRALGADVVFLSAMGHDMPGSILRSELRKSGVDDAWIVEDESISTLHKMRILANEQYVVRFDAGDTRHCSTETRRTLRAHLDTVFSQCDLVVVSDYGYNLASDDLIAHLSELRRSRRCRLVVDSKNLLRFRHARATVVTPNHLEARQAVAPHVSRVGGAQPEEMEAIGRRLLDLLDAEYVALTMAARGVLLLGRADPAVHLPALPVAQANDVGAGDSFAAAFALSLGAGASAEEAARIGIEAAGLAVGQRRTAVVRQQELLQRISLMEAGTPDKALALVEQIEAARQRGETIVFTNGVFDILHASHVQFLREARRLGDVLVVGVNSDNSARRLKGKNRPIIGERDRLALVAALDSVDHVVLFDDDTPNGVIRLLRPDIHVKGGDHIYDDLPEAEAVREAGARIVILPLAGSVSTTSVIERIVALAGDGRTGARS